MKLLQINAVYGQGSTGTIVKDIDESAQKNNIESFAAYSYASVKPKNGYRIGGFAGKKCHALLSRINGEQAYFSRFATIKLIKYIEKINPDIVHLHNMHSNFVNLNMLLDYLAKSKKKVFVTQHDCWFYTGKCFHYTSKNCYKWQTDCKNCPFPKSDTPAFFHCASEKILAHRKKYFSAIQDLTIINVSEWLSEETRKSVLKDKKIITIHNGVDTSVFKPTKSDFRKEHGMENDFVVLGMANKWLLPINKEITEKLFEEAKGKWRIVIAGCTDAQIASLKNKDVTAVGFTYDKTELAKLYTSADVFVNLSREDTLGLVNLESLACGTPIVANNATGISETVDENTGFLVTPGEIAQLISAIEKIRNSGRSFENACINRVKEHFEMKNNIQKYIDEYKKTENI